MIPPPIVPAKAVEIAAVVCDGVIFDLGGRRRAAASTKQRSTVGVGEVANLGPVHDDVTLNLESKSCEVIIDVGAGGLMTQMSSFLAILVT